MGGWTDGWIRCDNCNCNLPAGTELGSKHKVQTDRFINSQYMGPMLLMLQRHMLFQSFCTCDRLVTYFTLNRFLMLLRMSFQVKNRIRTIVTVFTVNHSIMSSEMPF